jgi:hypothetical protein
VDSQSDDLRQRAREKQSARDQDERDLASGAKTRAQLRVENAFLIPADCVIRLDLCDRLS